MKWIDAAKPRSGERLVLTAFVALYSLGGYFVVGLLVEGREAYSLRTPLDDAIPFLPWTVYLYSLVYGVTLLPVFTIRCPYLFRRTAVALALASTIAMTIFVTLPITSTGFRGSLESLDPSQFHNWGVRLTYALDPPLNLFPSMHLASACIAALACWKTRPAFGWLATAIAIAIGIAIFTMKQHFIADGVGALVLSAVVYLWILRPYPPRPLRERAFPLHHIGIYIASQVILFGGAYVIFFNAH